MLRRSRKGAWIEIIEAKANATNARVAPVRERGLKFVLSILLSEVIQCRSRKGAWIEIMLIVKAPVYKMSLP